MPSKIYGYIAIVMLLSTLCSTGALAQRKPGTDSPPSTAAALPRQPIAPDIKAEAVWDGRKVMPFHALDNPKIVKAAEADFLDDADYVLGITVHGESRAYPTRYVWFHHVINDQIGMPDHGGEVDVAVTYCSVCNTGVCYNPVIKGKSVKLDFYGLYNGVVALCDRNTESVLLQASGRFINGPLMNRELRPEPLLDTTWGKWKQLHPDTEVMSPDSPYTRYYAKQGSPEPRGYDRFPAPYFQPTVTRGDLRLPPFEKVLAVTLAAEGDAVASASRRAYPIKAVTDAGGVVNDTLAGAPVAILLDPATVTAVAVSRRIDGKTLTFEARKQADGGVAYYDKETGTRWNIEGLGEEGPLAGKTLTRLDNHLSQWYGWSAYFPDTTIYGRTDPPKPGDPFAAK